jgi:hypothetical protein
MTSAGFLSVWIEQPRRLVPVGRVPEFRSTNRNRCGFDLTLKTAHSLGHRRIILILFTHIATKILQLNKSLSTQPLNRQHCLSTKPQNQWLSYRYTPLTLW